MQEDNVRTTIHPMEGQETQSSLTQNPQLGKNVNIFSPIYYWQNFDKLEFLLFDHFRDIQNEYSPTESNLPLDTPNVDVFQNSFIESEDFGEFGDFASSKDSQIDNSSALSY